MTPRTHAITTTLSKRGEASTSDLIACLACCERDARLTLGIMARVGQIVRASPILRGPAKAPVKRVPRPRRKAVKATPPPVASAPKPTEKYPEKYSQPPRSAVPGGLTFIEASDAKGCLWAITMDKPFRFCGTARHSGSPYCTEHHRMGRATQKVPA